MMESAVKHFLPECLKCVQQGRDLVCNSHHLHSRCIIQWPIKPCKHLYTFIRIFPLICHHSAQPFTAYVTISEGLLTSVTYWTKEANRTKNLHVFHSTNRLYLFKCCKRSALRHVFSSHIISCLTATWPTKPYEKWNGDESYLPIPSNLHSLLLLLSLDVTSLSLPSTSPLS